jgi:hypothetical protein
MRPQRNPLRRKVLTNPSADKTDRPNPKLHRSILTLRSAHGTKTPIKRCSISPDEAQVALLAASRCLAKMDESQKKNMLDDLRFKPRRNRLSSNGTLDLRSKFERGSWGK